MYTKEQLELLTKAAGQIGFNIEKAYKVLSPKKD